MAQYKSRTAQLNGLTSLAYVGVLPSSPTNFLIKQGPPTTSDYRNVYVGDFWLDNSSMYLSPPVQPTSLNLWLLVSVAQHIATWVNLGSGTVISVGAGNSISITGTPTMPIVNVSGTVNHSVLLGNAVGGINSLANGTTGQILTAVTGGDPIWSTGGATGTTSFVTNSGTATPSVGVINILGTGGITTSGAGSTVTINGSGIGASSFITSPATGTATPAAGILTFSGTGGMVASASGSTVSYAPAALTCAFFVAIGAETNITGDATDARLGATATTTTVQFDLGGNITIGGGGVPTTFTAPATGYYQFNHSSNAAISVGGGLDYKVSFFTSIGGGVLLIDSPTRNQVTNFYGLNGQLSYSGSALLYMTSGSTATISFQSLGGAKIDGTGGSYWNGFRVA